MAIRQETFLNDLVAGRVDGREVFEDRLAGDSMPDGNDPSGIFLDETIPTFVKQKYPLDDPGQRCFEPVR